MILLDTCTLLWLVSDQKMLSKKAIEQIAKNASSIFVSAISGFEISIKCTKKLLKLPLTTQEWFGKALKLHGLTEIPVSSKIGILSAELPSVHKDPCDRIIISTAITHNLSIITPDNNIQTYPHVDVVW